MRVFYFLLIGPFFAAAMVLCGCGDELVGGPVLQEAEQQVAPRCIEVDSTAEGRGREMVTFECPGDDDPPPHVKVVNPHGTVEPVF